MKSRLPLTALLLAGLAGCAGLAPPTAEQSAALPVVAYPAQPAQAAGGDYIYKLPAGQPIDLRLRVDGTALAGGVDRTVSASLGHDLYLYRNWASEDGRHWQPAQELIGVNLTLQLPSYETPGAGELHLTVERKESP